MKNLKENFKKHWKLSLIICVLICVLGAGIWFASSFLGRDASSETYVVEVTDEKGKSVKEVYLVLCAEDGTELSWLPYVTNMSGKAQFSEAIEEGTYVKVVGVPFGYKLDESVKYTFDEEGKVKIVLIEDQSVYVAKIGDTMYGSLASALGVANSSSEDVVVELLADTMLKTFTINNNYGKNITLKGNGHTITAEGGNNTFIINQKEGVVAFEGLVLKHKNTGSAFHLNSVASVDLTDVEIDATGGNAYNYALINTLGVDGTTTLNLTRVNAKMAVGSPAKANEAGIIRTGNTSGTKTVNINMVDCNFDTTGATGRHGIVVMKNTVANLDIKNSIIRAGDAYAIWATEQTKAQTMTATNCQFLAETSPYSAAPIKGYAARIGNTYHLTLDHAAKVANESKKDVTITVVADITMKTCSIKNTKGATVTIDGAGKTVTTSGGNNAFVVGNNVAFKNLTIDHRNTGSAIHVTSAGNVKATDVYIKATEGKTYSYSLVNVLATGDVKSTLDFTRVKVVMAVESAGDGNASVIRTGNASTYYSDGTIKEDNSKIVDIKLTDCNFDTTKATGRTGITVTKNAKTTVELKNTTIKTMDAFAIRSNEQTIIWDNADTKLTSLAEERQIYPVEGYKAKIGEVFYTYKQAVDVANKAETDTEIKMLADHTITSSTINNKAGKLITLDGCGYTITSKGMENEGKPNEKSFNHALVVGNNVTLKNMKILHKNYGSAVQITDAGNVSLSKVEIDATSPYNNYEKKVKNTYTYALINVMAKGKINLDLSEVNVAMAVASMGQSEGQAAIIRTGNSGDEKTVNMTLENCNFDATQATGRNGILVMKGTVADIELKNTTIKTMDVATIKNLNTAAGEATANKDLLSVKATAYKGDVVTGYTYKSGDTWYAQFADAFEMAKTATEDVEITLTKDVEYDLSTLENKNGKKITVETDKYTLTATEDSTSDNLEVVSEAKTEIDGKTLYTTLKKALSSVQDGGTVELLQDVVVTSGNPAHTISKAITINGNEHSITSTDAVNNLFKTEKDVTLKNMTIVHNGYGAAVQVSKASKLTVADVVIDAKNPGAEGYKYALINVLAKQEGEDAPVPEVTLDFTNVKVDMDVITKPTEADKGAIIRTGNASDVKIVNINLNDSTLDATGAIDRHGIVVMAGTDATITLDKTSKVLSDNTSAIKTFEKNEGKVTVATGAEVKAEKADVVAVEGYTYHAEDTYYVNSDLTKLPASATEVTMLQNAEANFEGVKDIKILTDGHTLTTTGTKDASVEIVCEEVIKTADDGKTHYTSSASVEDLKKGYQAQIGDVLYKTLGKAVAAANEATTAATIDLLSNVEVKECTINKSMTINGNGFVMTTKGGNDAFLVDGEYQFKLNDLDIVHQNPGAIVKWAETKASGANVTLKDVNIDATQPGKDGYKYALFNILAKNDATKVSKLNFEKVSVDMDVATKATEHSKKWGAIVRTGNENAAKTVEIDLKNTILDASGALGRHGVLVMKGTNATVTMDATSKVKAYDVSAIQTLDTSNGTVTVATGAEVVAEKAEAFEGYKLQVGDTRYVDFDLEDLEAATDDVTVTMLQDMEVDLTDIKNDKYFITIETNGHTLTATGTKHANVKIESDEVLTVDGEDETYYLSTAAADEMRASKEVQIGTKLYASFANAVAGAKDGDVLEILKNIAIGYTALDKSITIDGNGHTIKNDWSNSSAHWFVVSEKVSHLEFKDVDMLHQRKGLVVSLQNGTGADDTDNAMELKFTDVTLTAKQADNGTATEWALINVLRDGETSVTMNDTSVEMIMKDPGSDKNGAIIRTGNASEQKVVNINLTNSTLDTTKAIERSAITVTSNTNATITLANTVLKTYDASAIKALDGASGCAVVPTSGDNANTLVPGNGAKAFEGYKLQVGDTRYVNFDLTTLENATSDVNVTMLQEMQVDLATVKNTQGNKITIDTAGYTLTATSAKDASVDVVCDEVLTVNGDTKTYYMSTEDAAEFKKNYEAQIGTKLYATLVEANNAAVDDDEIVLLKDITTGTSGSALYTISKAITINGNGKKITSPTTLNNLFKTTANVTLKDMTIVHKGSGAAIQIDVASQSNGVAIVNVNDVDIIATEPGTNGYKYALISIIAKKGNAADATTPEVTLNMTNVNIDMDVTTKGAQHDYGWSSIIRTGNENEKKVVNINLTNCDLDATDAIGRHGIVVMRDTVATIDLKGTNIKTQDISAIHSFNTTAGQVTAPVSGTNANIIVPGNGAKAIEGYNYKNGDTWYVAKPAMETITLTTDRTIDLTNETNLTINTNGHCLTTTGTKDATVVINSEAVMTTADSTLYFTLQEALERAESATGNVTITVASDCTVDVTNISNVNGHTITVDTGDYNVTVKGSLGQNVVIGEVYATGNVYMNMEKALASQSTVFMYRDLEEDLSAGAASTFTLKTNGYKLTTGTLGTNISVDSEASVPAGTDTTTYATLKDAIAVANAATSNVTVTVRKAFTANEGFNVGSQVRNATTSKITIDGGNYAITPAAGVEAVFTVNHTGNVEFKNVKITAGEVSGCKGIVIVNGGKITLDNPTITTKDALGVDNQSATALVKRLRNENGSIGTITSNINYKVGDVAYTDYSEALNAALTATQDVTIEVWSDITEELYVKEIRNANAVITIDGNSCSMTMGTGSQNAFEVKSKTNFKDIILNYSGKQAVIRANAAVDILLNNVDIYASTENSATYLYPGIINLLAKGKYSLALTDCEIYADMPYNSGSYGVIYTGNKGDAKELTITLTRSTIDTTQADGRLGILVTGNGSGDTQAEIELIDSVIKTKNITRTNTVVATAIYEQEDANSAAVERNSTVKLSGNSYISTMRQNDVLLEGIEATTMTRSLYDDSDSTVSTFSLEKQEQTTKTLTIEVPIDLYEKLVEWIKKFEFFDKLNIQW